MSKDIIERISFVTSKYFNLKVQDLYSKNKKSKVVIAKQLLWYILHTDLNISVGVLSKEFLRSRRNIFVAISKIRYGIKNQKYYQELYRSLKEETERYL